MEKLNTTKIEAITVSINYSDYLSQIISNKEKLDRWIIVTHEDDSDCIKVCEDNDIEYICSKRIYEDGSYFAKGKAINEGLELLDKDSWILHVDSDICLPDDFREIVQDNLNNKEKLYWNRRYDKETLEEIKWINIAWEMLEGTPLSIPSHALRGIANAYGESAVSAFP